MNPYPGWELAGGNIGLFICILAILFFTYSLFGWIWESAILPMARGEKFVNRGFLTGPYCPIYGVGALIFLLVGCFTDNKIELFFLGGIFACILEYIVSWVLEKLFHARWWDYSDFPANLNGRICLYGFLVFGLFSVLIQYVNNLPIQLLQNLPLNTIYLSGITIIIAIIIDTIVTTESIKKINFRLKKYQVMLEQKHPELYDFFTKNRKLTFKQTILDKQFHRILKAFPKFKSTRYNEALKELVNFQKNLRAKIKKSKFKPIKKK